MRKILLCAVLLLASLMAPAVADDKGTETVDPNTKAVEYGTYPVCIEYSSIPVKKTCLRLEWRQQADGTGVRLNSWEITTPDGCSSLEGEYSGSRRYAGTYVEWINRFGDLKTSDNVGYMGCSRYTIPGTDYIGTDQGAMNFTLTTKARVNIGGDWYLCWGIRLMPDGYYNTYRQLKRSPASPAANGCGL